jgi:uncharacterized protein
VLNGPSFIFLMLLVGVPGQMGPAAAAPPPIAQETADCATPTYASDTLVCGDEVLSLLDRELRDLLPVRNATDQLDIEPQADWFRRSRLCAFERTQYDCLRAAYRERIAVVRAANAFSAGTATWKTMRCGNSGVRVADLPRGIRALWEQDRLSLALAATELVSWKPFVYSARAGNNVRFVWLTGRTLNCRVGL